MICENYEKEINRRKAAMSKQNSPSPKKQFSSPNKIRMLMSQEKMQNSPSPIKIVIGVGGSPSKLKAFDESIDENNRSIEFKTKDMANNKSDISEKELITKKVSDLKKSANNSSLKRQKSLS